MRYQVLAATLALLASAPLSDAQVVVNQSPYASPLVTGGGSYGRDAYGNAAGRPYGVGEGSRTYGRGYDAADPREAPYGRQDGRRRYGRDQDGRDRYARPETEADDERDQETATPAEGVDQTRHVARDGLARVVGSDTLVVDGFVFKLAVDGPSPSSVCLGMTGQGYRCGQQAAVRLEKLVAGQRVRCEGTGNPAAVIPGSCRVGRTDLAKVMVRDGWARSGGGYEREEMEAKTNRRGMWSGSAPTAQ